MRCAWSQLLAVLPQWMRKQVDVPGSEKLQELRLRIGLPPELVCRCGRRRLDRTVGKEDICFVINTASQYSPWAAATSAQGYITASGGHRIGMCGEVVIHDGKMTGIRTVSSLCIRVARDFDNLATSLCGLRGSVLIIGKPGSGKTTLLRDLIRCRSEMGTGSVGVVDERGEIFPACGCFPGGSRTDVMRGCGKQNGIEILLRTMGPGTIAVDEITSEEDCKALIKAAWCGVDLFATAHASSRTDLHKRSVYRPLLQQGLFDHLAIVHEDKSCSVERMLL